MGFGYLPGGGGVVSGLTTQIGDTAPISGNFVRASYSLLPSSETTIYTCPSGKKAFVFGIDAFNTSTVVRNFEVSFRTGGVSYYLMRNQSISAGMGFFSNVVPGIILTSGESITARAYDAGYINIFLKIIEFSDSTPVRTVKVLSSVSGNNTLYTVPSGKTAIPLTFWGETSDYNVIGIFNNDSSTSLGATVYLNGTGAGNKVSYVSGISALSRGSISMNVSLNSGDVVYVNTNLANAFIWMNVLEV